MTVRGERIIRALEEFSEALDRGTAAEEFPFRRFGEPRGETPQDLRERFAAVNEGGAADAEPVGRFGGDILFRVGDRFAMLTVTDGEEEVLHFEPIEEATPAA